MVLVDTSIWVDFFNGIKNEKTDYLNFLIENNQVLICPIIIQEVLQGIRNDLEFELLKNDLLAFGVLIYDIIEAAIGAASIYRKARKKGITIRKSNDCLIAWYALKANVKLLAKDSDFELIAKFTDLRLTD